VILPGARLRLCLLIVNLVLVLGAGAWLMDFNSTRWIQSYLGYYFCTAALISGLVCAFRARVDGDGIFSGFPPRLALLAGLLAALGTYLLTLHEPFQMRVFNDEPTHALTAQAMAQERAVYSPDRAYFESGTLVYSDPEPFYRLYLYPYLVSVLHNTTGMRVSNVYAVNVAIGFSLLLVGFFLGWKVGGTAWAGFATQILLLGIPLLHHVINSAGYDPLNLLVFTLYLAAGLNYLNRGGTRRLDLAISLGILLAYCRSESILYLVALAALFLIRSGYERRFELSWYAVVSPVFLAVPLAAREIGNWLSSLLPAFYGNVESGFFGLQYLGRNSSRFLDWLFSTESGALNSWLVSGLLVVALLLIPFSFRRQKIDEWFRWRTFISLDSGLAMFSALAAVHCFLILCFFWDPTKVDAIRFFLPTTMMMILIIIRVTARIEMRWGREVFPALSGIACAFFWLVTLPKAARAEATRSSVSANDHLRALDWAQTHDDGRTLYAVKSLYTFILHGLPAISIQTLSNHPELVSAWVAEGYYDQVVVLEPTFFSPETHTWTQSYPIMTLSEKIRKEPIDGWRGFLHSQTQIYRVLGWEDEGGAFRPFAARPDGEPSNWRSDQEYFEYIRALHALKRPSMRDE